MNKEIIKEKVKKRYGTPGHGRWLSEEMREDIAEFIGKLFKEHADDLEDKTDNRAMATWRGPDRTG